MRKAAHESLLGRTIAGKYLVDSFVGGGAMGAVYRAHQVNLDKVVAIKVLHHEHALEPQFVTRFQREAKAASRLNHPNSMQVIDYGQEPDGLLYIAMEFLDGRNLHRVMREDAPLPAVRVGELLMQTLAALAMAHDEGVVHRDLKPDNIMVLRRISDDGHATDLVKVCDFGIAKITDARGYRGEPVSGKETTAPVTTAGLVMGTPEYMSPEQGKGEPLDLRSDLYSVGVILYQLLTGHVPFDAENAIGIILKHVTEEPKAPSIVAAGRYSVHAGLEAVCLRALQKSPAQRYANAREMRADIRAAVEPYRLTPPGSSAPSYPHLVPPSVPSGPRLSPSDPRSEPVVVTAATVPIDSRALGRAREASSPPEKPTFVGTETEIAGLPKHRRLVAIVAFVAAAMGLGLSLAVYMHLRAPEPEGAKRRASASAAPLTELVADKPLDPLEGPSMPRATATAIAPSGKRGASAPSARASVSAAATTAASSAATATATATANVTATATETATATTPATATATSVTETFDIERAYVEVGMVSAQHARDSAVRGAVRTLPLTSCYKIGLRSRRAPVTGGATLSLSMDEQGVVRSAILVGLSLPDAARCIQGAASGLTLPRGSVDPGGGTADVFLTFRIP